MSIARRIVQTHRDESLAQDSRASWLAQHPGFDYVFYDDTACRKLIAERFPSLLPTYDKLPLAVQKADLFRYAAIYDGGGVYADTDTRCCAPLASYLDLDTAQLAAGLEMAPASDSGDFSSYTRSYCLPHQLLQWTFAASQGHPALALMLRRIEFNVAHIPSEKLVAWSRSTRFTLELTGPMIFTQVCDEFLSGTRRGRVRVLGRLVWGSYRQEQARPELADRIKVAHLFAGSWLERNTGAVAQGQAAQNVKPASSSDNAPL